MPTAWRPQKTPREATINPVGRARVPHGAWRSDLQRRRYEKPVRARLSEFGRGFVARSAVLGLVHVAARDRAWPGARASARASQLVARRGDRNRRGEYAAQARGGH